MGAVGVVLVVAFVIVCFLAILLVMVQNDETGGMGGLFGGRTSAAFGSHSASVLTKTTFVFVVLFFAFSIALAVLNKSPALAPDLVAPSTDSNSGTEQTENNDWWKTDAQALESAEPAAAGAAENAAENLEEPETDTGLTEAAEPAAAALEQ